MSHKINLVRVLTAATGNSTPITLGAAYSQLFMLPSEAGAMDGRTYTYNIVDGNNWEIGRGVYTASGTTLARTTILASRISGTLGTSRISLSGTAQVRFIDSAEDMDGVRGTRAVTGTTDTLNNSDLGCVVTYSNAAAVAVSLAQASASNLFIDGWAVWVRNNGAGAVTITPATSTINGAASLVLAANQGAMIWSDGTNYQAFVFGVVVGTTAGTVAAGDDARIVGAASRTSMIGFLRSQLAGLTLSTAGSTATFGIAAGVAADSTNADMMTLTSAFTKTTTAWAVGSGNGSLDTGSLAGLTWYHVHLIKRSDTGVIDVLISTSASSPTLPTSYTLARRIGSMKTNGSGQWVKFTQIGDEFLWDAAVSDVSAQAIGTTALLLTLANIPPSITVTAKLNLNLFASGGTQSVLLLTSPMISVQVANSPAGNYSAIAPNATSFGQVMGIVTSTQQVRAVADSACQLYISTAGWTDRRGRDA